MKNKTPSILLILCIAVCVTNCKKDDDDGFDGSRRSIEDFFNPELVEALEDLGIDINTGNTPPNIEGTFFASPLILKVSTVPTDIIGTQFYDIAFTFSNQNNQELTIDFLGVSVIETDVGNGSFISGEGNKFSIFLKTESTIGNYPAESAITISGTFTTDGINELHMAYLMLDNKGNIEEVYIDNNQGRLLYDSDSISEKDGTSETSKSTITQLNKLSPLESF